jgi:hypothetical protein
MKVVGIQRTLSLTMARRYGRSGVIYAWKAMYAANTVDFFLCALLDLGKHHHGLHESDQDCRGGVGASLQQRATKVCGLLVGHLLFVLDAEDIVAEAGLCGDE